MSQPSSFGEFDLIERYFRLPAQQCAASDPIALGIGDDCALLKLQAGMSLAISSDMLVEGRHFLSTINPERLGHKALAVNLSDLAAMGAKPLAFTLALAMNQIDEAWCEMFSRGLFALANHYDCALIGGDITKGPLCISITIFGEVPSNQRLLRSHAQIGDDIYVSHLPQGGIGDARLTLEALRGKPHLLGPDFDEALNRMECPHPRIALGLAIRNIAHATIDLSDGLLGDLGHILKASQVGAHIDIDNIPRSHLLRRQSVEMQRLCTLSGGDDYELIFTAPPSTRAQVLAAAHNAQMAVTVIGKIEEQLGIRLLDARGSYIDNTFTSFDHFKSQ